MTRLRPDRRRQRSRLCAGFAAWSTILLAKFREEDVAAGKIVSQDASLKQVVNRLDAASLLPAGWDPYVRARAEAMLAGYDAFWTLEGFEALEVERSFRLPLINPESGHPSRTWELGGTVDGIVRGADGRVWVLEHKTTSEDAGPGSAYRRRLAMDGQVSQYIEGAAALGYEVAGVLYDVLVKPDLRPLRATPPEQRKYTRPTKADPTPRLYAAQRDRDETPAEYGARVVDAIVAAPHRYFARLEVVRLEHEREDWRFDVWQLAEQMRASARTGRAPKNPDACFRYGTPCAFFDACTGASSLDDPTRFVRAPAPAAPAAASGRAA